MKIKLDKTHYLVSDPYCYWITCETKTKDGKPCERRVSGYMPTLELAVENFIDGKIRGSNAKEMAEISKLVAEIKEDVRTWKRALSR